MIFDALVTFATDETANTDGEVGDVVDLSALERDIADGNPLYVHFVHTAATAGNTDLDHMELMVRSGDSATSLSSNFTEHAQVDLRTGREIGDVDTVMLHPSHQYRRYLGIYSDELGVGASAKVTIFLSLSPYTYGRSYPDAVN